MARFDTFIGSFKKVSGAAILRCVFDSQTGTLEVVERYETVRPSYIVLSPDNNRLYCINEAEEIDGVHGGAVESVDVSGNMCRISRQSLHAGGPSHLCLYGDKVIVSIYGEGALVQAQVNVDGEIQPINRLIKQFGKSINPERQDRPHPHFVTPTPCGKYIAMADLGLDKIFFYPIDNESGLSLNAKAMDTPAGEGPRHMAYSEDGRMLYVLTEIGNTILVYRDYKLVQRISTLPDGFAELSWGSALRFTRDKKQLAASNRLNDTIAFFDILADGTLRLNSHVATGRWPRDFEFTPDGGYMIVANQNDDTLVVYKQTEDGWKIIQSLKTDILPCCVVFGKQY